MPPPAVAYVGIKSPSFLGGNERLRRSLMFHCGQKWRTRSVKRIAAAEGRAIFDHDNEAAHYIWGAMNSSVDLSDRGKNPDMVVKALWSGGGKILLQGLLCGANELCILRLRQIIGIYFVAMLPADGGKINAVKNQAQSRVINFQSSGGIIL